MKKRFLAAVMATAMAATLLAGCGGSSDSASSAASSAASEAAEAVSEAADDAAEAASSAASEAAEAASSAASEAAETVSEAADAGADAAEGWVMDMDNMLAGSPFDGLTANDEYTYQLIVKAFSASFFTAVVEGANAAAADLGVKLDCMGPNTESDIADQVNMLNAAILNHVDGIAFAACDSNSVQDSLNKAKEEGVPIIAFDSGVENPPEGSVLGTVATDSPAAGAIAAENVYNAISFKIGQGAPIRIGMVANDSTSASNTQRGIGFVNGIIEKAAADGYKVAVTGNEFFVGKATDKGDENDCDIIIECRVPATAMVDLCASEVSAIINKEDTVAVFGTNQTVTEGMIQANSNLDVLGSDPETNIIGAGFDAGATIKEAVADGTLFGCVTQMPYAMGYFSVASLVANNNGDEVGDLPIPAYWYNADNMEDPLIAPNLYD